MAKYEQEFIEQVEKLRGMGANDYKFMLDVLEGVQDAIKVESDRKTAYAKSVKKEMRASQSDDSSESMSTLLGSISGTSKITEEELEIVMTIIEENFTGKTFKSKDLSALMPLGKDGLPVITNRQMPSRIKRLLAFGKIEDKGGSPKSYAIKK